MFFKALKKPFGNCIQEHDRNPVGLLCKCMYLCMNIYLRTKLEKSAFKHAITPARVLIEMFFYSHCCISVTSRSRIPLHFSTDLEKKVILLQHVCIG